MKIKSIHIYILVLIALSSIATAIIAVEVREVETRLTSSDVQITVEGDREKIELSGPIDFWHENRHIKAGKGTLILMFDEKSNDRIPLALNASGSVEYDDVDGYKVNCGSAMYDFKSGGGRFQNGITLTGENMKFTAKGVDVDTINEVLNTFGPVAFEGKTQKTLLVQSTLSGSGSDQSGSDTNLYDYYITGNSLNFQNKINWLKIGGGVTFRLDTTNVQCDSVLVATDGDEIKSIDFMGHVTFADPDMQGTAWRVYYDRDHGKLTLEGDPKNSDPVRLVYKGQNVSGQSVTLNLTNGRELVLDEGKISITPGE